VIGLGEFTEYVRLRTFWNVCDESSRNAWETLALTAESMPDRIAAPIANKVFERGLIP
jgi:hypothetical protein